MSPPLNPALSVQLTALEKPDPCPQCEGGAVCNTLSCGRRKLGLTPAPESIFRLLARFETASNKLSVLRQNTSNGTTSHTLTTLTGDVATLRESLLAAMSKLQFPEGVPSHHLNSDKTVAVGTHEWISMQHCPVAAKVWLLNPGGFGTQGTWDGKDRQWLGWFPFPSVPDWMKSPVRAA